MPERAALAAALRAEGRRDDAAALARLRKPSVAAWAVNQLVRTQHRALTELFEAGDELRAAHEQALSGRGGAAAMRAAGERERKAVDALMHAARGLLSPEGHELSGVVLERVADTLHAAALEDEARRAVAEARLERELRHVGLGMAAGAAAGAAPPRGRRRRDDVAAKEAKRAEVAANESTRDEAAANEAKRADAAKEAKRAEERARQRAEAAALGLQAAEERRRQAAEELGRAERELVAAGTEAQAAEEELERLRRR